MQKVKLWLDIMCLITPAALSQKIADFLRWPCGSPHLLWMCCNKANSFVILTCHQAQDNNSRTYGLLAICYARPIKASWRNNPLRHPPSQNHELCHLNEAHYVFNCFYFPCFAACTMLCFASSGL